MTDPRPDEPGPTDPRPTDPEVPSPVCSAKGCRCAAAWVLAWNNPKLHTPGRRKTWTACDEHREHLTQFLQTRGFLRETVPIKRYGGESPSRPSSSPQG